MLLRTILTKLPLFLDGSSVKYIHTYGFLKNLAPNLLNGAILSSSSKSCSTVHFVYLGQATTRQCPPHTSTPTQRSRDLQLRVPNSAASRGDEYVVLVALSLSAGGPGYVLYLGGLTYATCMFQIIGLRLCPPMANALIQRTTQTIADG